MVRDDDHFEDMGDLCLQNLICNENVMKQAIYDPEDYVVDDDNEWYNFLYDCDGG